MRNIEFHNRENEMKEIRAILDAKPTLITFIYGPINSGKTELISRIVPVLPEKYVVFYINLRGWFIKSYEEFLDVLFEIDEERKIENAKEYAKAILKDLKIIGGIPIPINLFEKMFERKDRSKDVFRYIESFMVEISKKYIPVLILDELQVIGDVKIDDLLIYKLFNFFIRLTKELHLCHVFAVSSDSLFIERVYSEAMLQGRGRYLRVDDFDYEATADFLEKHGFSIDEKELAWEYCGGKPVCLIELINAKDRAEKLDELLQIRIGQIEGLIEDAREFGYKIYYGDEEIVLNAEHLLKSIELFVNADYIKANALPKSVKIGLINANILFLDPVKRIIKPQSKLDLLAIRAVMRNSGVRTDNMI